MDVEYADLADEAEEKQQGVSMRQSVMQRIHEASSDPLERLQIELRRLERCNRAQLQKELDKIPESQKKRVEAKVANAKEEAPAEVERFGRLSALSKLPPESIQEHAQRCCVLKIHALMAEEQPVGGMLACMHGHACMRQGIQG
jgi:hypothetical protein